MKLTIGRILVNDIYIYVVDYHCDDDFNYFRSERTLFCLLCFKLDIYLFLYLSISGLFFIIISIKNNAELYLFVSYWICFIDFNNTINYLFHFFNNKYS